MIPRHDPRHRPKQESLDGTEDLPDRPRPEFTLLVAGCCGGKTSFLRLLLDTSRISHQASPDQLSSVAKFVQGSSGHTPHVRSTTVDIDLDVPGNDSVHRPLILTLVDTPSLDFRDNASVERSLSEVLRFVEGRFSEAVEGDYKSNTDRFVHLCMYFLDPDRIVPPSIPTPPVPVVPRTRTSSFSQPDPEPVYLEPPVATNPLHYRPCLPVDDIDAIRRLSARVNVLPVIARADILSNERLVAIKMAVRRDLADAGIGFGIFDLDNPSYQQPAPPDVDRERASASSSPRNGLTAHHNANGSGSASNSPPTTTPASPTAAPSLLRLPYALISPDIYSHSDGVPRIPPSRAELVQSYTPLPNPSAPYHASSPSKLVRGKFIRSYRWASLDVLDPSHCDFVQLRAAVFHHMETLRKYTREYLFEKFKTDYHIQHRHSLTLPPPQAHHSHLPHAHSSLRPTLAIDTTGPSLPTSSRHTSLNILPVIEREAPPPQPPQIHSTSTSARVSPKTANNKQRTKKITVACNFCRSRKLKCDGGRPACGQCVKRTNPCDYQPQNKRRGAVRRNKAPASISAAGGGGGGSTGGGDESESESDEEDQVSRSGSPPALLPQQAPLPPHTARSRNNSVVERDAKKNEYPSTPIPPPPPPSLPSISTEFLNPRNASGSRVHSGSASISAPGRGYFVDNELPHIATLSLPDPSPSVPMSAPSLPPIQAQPQPPPQNQTQRRRAATVPGKSTSGTGRLPTTSGPKIVACNFCRARKTKCDGAHPACSSCARRSLPCNYVHDRGGSNNGEQKKAGNRRASAAAATKPPLTASTSASTEYPPSSPPSSSRMVATTPASAAYEHHGNVVHSHEDTLVGDASLKRDYMDDLAATSRPSKKMRVTPPHSHSSSHHHVHSSSPHQPQQAISTLSGIP
ncbi:gtp binding protein [Moniliophthora roreri]|nr:gtp binding protein [Moniliophthora roreri]